MNAKLNLTEERLVYNPRHVFRSWTFLLILLVVYLQLRENTMHMILT